MMAMIKRQVTPLFKKMMDHSDRAINFDPQKDYCKHDLISGESVEYGYFRSIRSNQSVHFDTETTFKLKQRSTGLINEVMLKYVTNPKQSLKLTLIDISGVISCHHHDPDIELISCIAVIRPMKDQTFQTGLKNGTYTPENVSFNAHIVNLDLQFEYEEVDWEETQK